MFGLNVFVEPQPTGTIDATKQDKYNIQHRNTDAKLFVTEEHTDNNFRQEGSLPSQIPHHYVIHHDSVTMHLNNLQNFNPTSAGVTYYKEHETNMHIHHGGIETRNLSPMSYDPVIGIVIVRRLMCQVHAIGARRFARL